MRHYEFRAWEQEKSFNDLLFSITDGDMTQVNGWLSLELFDFYAKLESFKEHMKRKMPKDNKSGVKANTRLVDAPKKK